MRAYTVVAVAAWAALHAAPSAEASSVVYDMAGGGWYHTLETIDGAAAASLRLAIDRAGDGNGYATSHEAGRYAAWFLTATTEQAHACAADFAIVEVDGQTPASSRASDC